jgi:rSAM/selenodomain-associated transferase 2
MKNPIISIIIPVLNEAENIQSFLKQFENYLEIEIIIVDGGSTDKTKVKILESSLCDRKIKLVTNNKVGRANQMNYGAVLATGEILLFLHADTILPDNYQQIAQSILKRKDVIVGAFQLHINSPKKTLRLVEKIVNLRSRFLSLPYGDQGFFITKDNFERLGGFADLPIMEDFNFIQKAKRNGKIVIADATVMTSPRRWQKIGVIKTTVINQLIIVGYYLKISPNKLKTFYHRAKIINK